MPLRPLAHALARASTAEEVFDALVNHGLHALNACVAVLALRSEDGSEFYCPHIAGYPEEVANAWRRFPADAQVPIAAAVRENRPILLENLERRRAFYPPDLKLPPPVGRALAAIPFKRGDVAGGLGFTFPDDRAFGEEDRQRLEEAANLCAEALARVRLLGLGCEVLVVEDEPQVLSMIDFVMRYHAFTVRRALGGEEAIRVYRQHHETVAVVLLDVQMPRMDGPETLAVLREINPAVRCVFMSGYTGKYTAEQLLALGASRVLEKPFSGLDEVMQTVRTAARQR